MLFARKKPEGRFSLEPGIIGEIFEHAKPLGHHEDVASLNLGFGFLYYGLVRTLRPKQIVVIGSGFGFSVVCLALGLKDNREGKLSFVDPSYSLLKNGPLQTIGGQAQWDNPQSVRARFVRFGVESIVTHYRQTSAEFFEQFSAHGHAPIDIAFIDGNHSYGSVRHDFLEALNHSHRNSYLLLHDTHLVVRELIRHAGVKRLVRRIARHTEDFEVIDFPFSSGVALIRVVRDGPWQTLVR